MKKSNAKPIMRVNSSAQALIEFALVLPILLLLVLGALDFGRMFFMKMALINAAREGANHLSFFPDDASNGYADTYAAIIAEGSTSLLTVTSGDVTITGCCTRGLPVEVQVTNTIDLVYDGVLQSLGLIGGPVQLTGSVQMVVQ